MVGSVGGRVSHQTTPTAARRSTTPKASAARPLRRPERLPLLLAGEAPYTVAGDDASHEGYAGC
ncbi:hypothetical protein P354_25120 [Streptomyces noursei PD-1]|nr:hypothetical protein K530_51255 [Streptomyces noursei CCRC 11814]EXU89032.1 hypothetical protein P354_25120 [Streptomyces noursei PD-1]